MALFAACGSGTITFVDPQDPSSTRVDGEVGGQPFSALSVGTGRVVPAPNAVLSVRFSDRSSSGCELEFTGGSRHVSSGELTLTADKWRVVDMDQGPSFKWAEGDQITGSPATTGWVEIKELRLPWDDPGGEGPWTIRGALDVGDDDGNQVSGNFTARLCFDGQEP